MSRFKKLSHTLWHCTYHIIWTPKYRYRILKDEVESEINRCIRQFSSQKGCFVEELNIQPDHVHLLVRVPPKISISSYVGMIKGRSAIRIFEKFKRLKERPYWGNHFRSTGYCVDTVGLNEEMIRRYVKYQEDEEKQQEKK